MAAHPGVTCADRTRQRSGSPAAQIMPPAGARLCCDGAGYELPFRVGSPGMALSCEESDDAARAHQR
jgi:hypothetical protein